MTKVRPSSIWSLLTRRPVKSWSEQDGHESFARRGGGKSGGYRIITFYAAMDVPVFLLDVFGKGDKANLSKAERNELAKVLGLIADTYRAGAKTAAAMERKGKLR